MSDFTQHAAIITAIIMSVSALVWSMARLGRATSTTDVDNLCKTVAVLQQRVDAQQKRLESNDRSIRALEENRVHLMQEAVHLKAEATTLRQRVTHLEMSLERAVRRVRQLTAELIAHDVPVPPEEEPLEDNT